MSEDVPHQVYEGLADTLWLQRHRAEALLFRMVVAELLLAAREHRFVGAALDEVDAAAEALEDAERLRVAAVERVARSTGLPAGVATLADLVDHAPEPLRLVFEDHHRAFVDLTTEIARTADATRHLASDALGRVRRQLDALASPVAGGTST